MSDPNANHYRNLMASSGVAPFVMSRSRHQPKGKENLWWPRVDSGQEADFKHRTVVMRRYKNRRVRGVGQGMTIGRFHWPSGDGTTH